MHAGIGPTCGYGSDGLNRVKFSNRSFQGFLNAGTACLALPAVKCTAVVLKAKSKPTPLAGEGAWLRGVGHGRWSGVRPVR
jgi:hypothetical protein